MKPTTDGITADVGQSNEDSSRFTRCPYCQAVFRVRPAKLAIRQGEVRCGACREVFNAIRHFVVQADTGRFIPDERAFEGFDTDPIQSGIFPMFLKKPENNMTGSKTIGVTALTDF